MRSRTALLVAPLLAALAAGCIGGRKNIGVTDPSARSDLAAQRITYAKDGALFVSRGDGARAVRLMRGEELGEGGTIFMPSLTREWDRVLFIGALDLHVHDSTSSQLQLNILHLEGERIDRWRSIILDRILPAGDGGRYEIFSVAAAAWSLDASMIAMGLNLPEDQGGDVVMIFDADGVPVRRIDLGDRSLPRVGSIDWMGPGSLLLGLEGEAGGPGTVARLDLGSVPGSTPRLIDIGTGDYPALSPSMDRIAVVEQDNGQWDIVLLDRDGEEMDRYERPAGRALNRPYWSRDGRYLYYYSLASTGPLGIVEITILRCLDTRSRLVYDLVRLG